MASAGPLPAGGKPTRQRVAERTTVRIASEAVN